MIMAVVQNQEHFCNTFLIYNYMVTGGIATIKL